MKLSKDIIKMLLIERLIKFLSSSTKTKLYFSENRKDSKISIPEDSAPYGYVYLTTYFFIKSKLNH